MTEASLDYTKLDQPEVLRALFHPRKESTTGAPPGAVDWDIPVGGAVMLGARFYLAGKEDTNLLFFHGNGEIASDYDPIGPVYNEYGLSLLAVDYRGYGRSGGVPTASAMMRDAHAVFREVRQWLGRDGRTGPLIVMGRSLGSACALELAASYENDLAGMIVESGFAMTVPLLNCLGVDTGSLGIAESDGFKNAEKIARFKKPTLIIHGQHDRLIPISNAERLQVECAARSKEFQVVPGADHNTILVQAGKHYFEAIKAFANKIQGKRSKKRFRDKPRPNGA